jgi:hypothetical protein
VLDGGHLDVDVDAVEERAGDLVEIFADGGLRGAAPFGIAEAAAAGAYRLF